ncbi:MAG: methyltransferase domain-containing protein [bacterium]|nr:methyltransferase domain-containing protein [bacterium]
MSRERPFILFLPQYSHRIGFGHLKRSQALSSILARDFKTLILPYPLHKEDEKHFQDPRLKYIVLDHRYYSKTDVKRLSAFSGLVLIDSPQTFHTKKKAVYINSSTPIQYKFLRPNQFLYTGLTCLPLAPLLREHLKKKDFGGKGIFIGFGNTDPNELSLKALKYLEQAGIRKAVTLNIGGHFKPGYKVQLKEYIKKNFPGCVITENVKSIIPHLFRNGYLITSFSITALEAMMMNKKTALLNHSPYHTFLSRRFNRLFYLGTYRRTPGFLVRKRLKKFFASFSPLPVRSSGFISNNQNLVRIFRSSGSPGPVTRCPVCGSGKIQTVLREHRRQMNHCASCRSKFLDPGKGERKRPRYTKNYFQDEYKDQYGKTYLEDRENITRLSRERLGLMAGLMPEGVSEKKLLDIGCAFGFFLEEAGRTGYRTYGIEIEKKAAEYAKNVLKLNVIQGDFLSRVFKDKFDVMTFWYVFEHFSQPDRIMKKVTSLLTPDGWLCLSLPNGDGPFYRYNRLEWLQRHPDDHYFDYSVKGLKLFLAGYGLKLKKKRITGFHPERYIGLPAFLRPVWKVLHQGDTMELYFNKS